LPTGGRATDIRSLRAFVEIVRSGGISRAAARMHIAQPALSRQVQKLEEELGTPLLRRHGRGVTATAPGLLLLDRAETLLRQFDSLPNEIRRGEEATTGHVVLGVPPAAGLVIAPAAVKLFQARFPHATLQVREGISSLLEEWLLDRRLDVAVLHNPPAMEDVTIRTVLRERMVLACPPSTAPGADAPLRFPELSRIPLILPSLPHANRRLVERAAAQHRVRLHLALEVDSVALTKAMVRGGLGSTILTLAGVSRELRAGELGMRAIHRPPLHSVIAIGTLASGRPGALLRAAETIVREVIATAVANGEWPGARLVDHPVRAEPAPNRPRTR
jgi:LysR family transcriptional regulator, nitrogen assimilation regulatory protein